MTKLMLSPKWLGFLDAVWLAILAFYVLAGVRDVPFHGDESTIIWMSADFDSVVLNGDPAAVTYSPPPRRTTEQHLRILNGTLTRWAMGSAWAIGGFDRADLNDQWVWGPDRAWNRANGHMPSARLLHITRFISALFGVVSMALILAATRLVADRLFSHRLISAAAGWLSMALYTLNPVVLMNARRAMFEGAMLFGLALVGWTTLRLVNRSASFKGYVGLGIAAGIALSAKHSAAFTIAPLFFGLAAVEWRKSKSPSMGRIFFKLGLAAMTALIVFFALTPLWWSSYIIDMPSITFDERQKLLDEQVALFGGYAGIGERLEGLWQATFGVAPQYYEADYWGDYPEVEDEIQRYEDGYLAGINSPVAVVMRAVLVLAGLFALGMGWRQGEVMLMAIWIMGIVLVSLLTIPIDWQRYYLPIQTPLAILMGLGGAAILQTAINRGQAKHVTA